MPIIEESIVICLPSKEVYRIAQDYSVRFDWDPFPERLEMIDGNDYKPSIGGKVFIRSKLGISMTVEFVQVNPPNTDAIKMVSGPWYLKKFAGSWLFKPINEDRTLVKFRYSIQAKGFLIKHLIEAIAVIYFCNIVKKRLEGLRDIVKD